jgi:hypothetical protein
MPSTRSPIVVLAGLVVVAAVPLVVMWAAVGGLELLGYLVGFAVYFLAVHVFVPARVYLDAVHRGRNGALTWTAVAFLLPLVGAALYVLVGRLTDRNAEAA